MTNPFEKNEPRVKIATPVASQNIVPVILVLSLVVLLISRAISGM